MQRRRSLTESFNSAIEGFLYCLKTQRNMRLHFILAICVLVAGLIFNLSRLEMLLILGAITFVLLAEMLNTALEHMVDLSKPEFHPLAQTIKDVSAGAVFISAVNAVIVGYLLLSQHLDLSLQGGLQRLRSSSWHLAFVSLVLVLGLVVVGKSVFHRGHPLRGGMPSGHAAVGFAVWMLVALLQDNVLITLLVFIMAATIAFSRLKNAVHSLWEVLIGCLLGSSVAFLVYQFFKIS
jgi:diacylglycerol kinase (ATP)